MKYQGELQFDDRGLDAHARRLCEERLKVIREWAASALTDLTEKDETASLDPTQVRLWLCPMLETISQAQLLTLAQLLGFDKELIRVCVHSYWRHSAFNYETVRPDGRIVSTPASLEDVLEKVEIAFGQNPDITRLQRAIRGLSICHHEKTADRLARDLVVTRNSAARQVLVLLSKWCSQGEIGLLEGTDYPCLEELKLLQVWAAGNQEAGLEMRFLVPRVQADVIALAVTLKSKEILTPYQINFGRAAKAWDLSLLLQPRENAQRQLCRERLQAVIGQAQPLYQKNRGCLPEEAVPSIEAIVDAGLDGLVALYASPNTRQSYNAGKEEQIAKKAAQALHGLSEETKAIILKRFHNLYRASQLTRANIRFPPLLTALPSSDVRRRQQRVAVPEICLQEFARLEGVELRQAKKLIRRFKVYGPPGLAEATEWQNSVHPSLWSYMHMFKFGWLERNFDTTRLTGAVNRYAGLLGQPALTKMVVVGLTNHFQKPDYYNSGDGSGTAGVPIRKSLKLAGVHRLHEQWIVVKVELDFEVVNASLRPIASSCYGLVMMDRGSERPVALLLSANEPGPTEVLQLVYRAIWHPDAPMWPLRGLPEHIIVPIDVASPGLKDLTMASSFLLANIFVEYDPKRLLNSMPFAKKLLDDLQEQFGPERVSARKKGPRRQVSLAQAHEQILKWFRDTSFPEHRVDPVPKAFRASGMALPGYDTPAAGWLHPLREEVTTIRDGVDFNGYSYRSTSDSIEPGQTVWVRALGDRPNAVFIQIGCSPALRYLWRQGRA